MWYNGDWTYRKKITIDHTKVSAPSGGLVDFPIYLDLSGLGSDFFSNVKSDGSDIVVTSSDGTTKLKRELVSIDTSSGTETGELWVKLPILDDSVDTEIYIYYGNSGASETNDTDAWNSNYKLVQHLNEDPSGSGACIKDSTSNGNDGIPEGSMASEDSVDGKLYEALDVDGSDDLIDCGTDSSLDITSSITISGWIKPDSSGAYDRAIDKEQDAGGESIWAFGLWTGTTKFYGGLWFSGSQSYDNTDENLPTDSFSYCVMTYDGNKIKLYLDGVLKKTINKIGTIDSSSKSVNIGGSDWIDNFDGKIDEIRISNSAHSEEWVATEYNNQDNPSSFYTIGSQENNISLIDINNEFRMIDKSPVLDIINKFHTVIEEKSNITNEYRFSKETIIDINNTFSDRISKLTNIHNIYRLTLEEEINIINNYRNRLEVVSDISNKFHFGNFTISDIINKFHSKKLVFSNIQNKFRMRASYQIPGIAGVQPLGKEYFTVKIDDIDITESLKVDIDSLRWKEILNAPATANFTLALPYDSEDKPDIDSTVEILFNDKRKFYGYIKTISETSEPEGIHIYAEGEYKNINEEIVNFYIGRKPNEDVSETYYTTYKQALEALGASFDIGNFVPVTESHLDSFKADTISKIISDCGNFAWFIKPDGTKKLWRGGKGNIISLEPQSIGENLDIYQIIQHDIQENDSEQIDKIKVIMGDDIKIGYDNTYRDVRVWTAFVRKDPRDAEIYDIDYTPGAGVKQAYDPNNWQRAQGNTLIYNSENQESTEAVIDGWNVIIPPGYGTPPQVALQFPLIPSPEFYFYSLGNESAGEDIMRVINFIRAWNRGGFYPEGKKEHIFYVGSGDRVKTLDLSNLNRQYGTNYTQILDIYPYNFRAIFLPITWDDWQPGDSGSLYALIPGLHIESGYKLRKVYIPSWNDTSYAEDIANFEYAKFKDTKQTGEIQLTIDCADFYELDLSKRIQASEILDSPANIKSIEYNARTYLVTIEIESNNEYKRSVSLPTHEDTVETIEKSMAHIWTWGEVESWGL